MSTAIKHNLSAFRNVKVAFDDAAGQDIVSQTPQKIAPVDFFAAAAEYVYRAESGYHRNAGTTPDLTDKLVRFTGANSYRFYEATLTTDMGAGNYIIVFQQVLKNAEG